MIIRDNATKKVLLRFDSETFEITESNSPEVEALWLDWMENGITTVGPLDAEFTPTTIIDGTTQFFPQERLGLVEMELIKRGLILEL